MRVISTVREWPPVLRVALIPCFLGMIIFSVAAWVDSGQRWMYAIAPAAYVVFGLLLALNVSGSATSYAASAAKHRPISMSSSTWLFAKPRFARVFGALMVLVGGM